MRDSLNTLFQQRFQGHEAPVDAGVWEGIQQQLATAPAAADGVNELFKERFQGHEAPVDPAVWANISSQLGHTAVAGTAAGTIWAWVAAGTAAVVITATALFWEPGANEPQQVVQVVEQQNHTDQPQHSNPSADVQSVEPKPAPTPVVERHTTEPGPKKQIRSAMENAAQTGPPPQTTPSEPVVVPAPSPKPEGNTVVSGIISQLEEDVKQQPVTAKPEPGLKTSKTTETPTQQPSSQTDTPPVEEVKLLPVLPKLFMPNTFTPNGDGVNDTYTVDGDGYAAVLMRVYSMKSNALVFSSNGGEPWTGTGCEDGMYMVAVEAHTHDGRTTTEGKVVWLNRNPIN